MENLIEIKDGLFADEHDLLTLKIHNNKMIKTGI